MIYGILLCIGLVYGMPDAASANDIDTGKSIYESTCVACHDDNGKGLVPGAPDFTDAKGPLNKTDAELAVNITNGYQSSGSMLAMPPKGGNPALTKEEVDKVVKYIRNRFGEQ